MRSLWSLSLVGFAIVSAPWLVSAQETEGIRLQTPGNTRYTVWSSYQPGLSPMPGTTCDTWQAAQEVANSLRLARGLDDQPLYFNISVRPASLKAELMEEVRLAPEYPEETRERIKKAKERFDDIKELTDQLGPVTRELHNQTHPAKLGGSPADMEGLTAEPRKTGDTLLNYKDEVERVFEDVKNFRDHRLEMANSGVKKTFGNVNRTVADLLQQAEAERRMPHRLETPVVPYVNVKPLRLSTFDGRGASKTATPGAYAETANTQVGPSSELFGSRQPFPYQIPRTVDVPSLDTQREAELVRVNREYNARQANAIRLKNECDQAWLRATSAIRQYRRNLHRWSNEVNPTCVDGLVYSDCNCEQGKWGKTPLWLEFTAQQRRTKRLVDQNDATHAAHLQAEASFHQIASYRDGLLKKHDRSVDGSGDAGGRAPGGLPSGSLTADQLLPADYGHAR